jgi:hypothetical protein
MKENIKHGTLMRKKNEKAVYVNEKYVWFQSFCCIFTNQEQYEQWQFNWFYQLRMQFLVNMWYPHIFAVKNSHFMMGLSQRITIINIIKFRGTHVRRTHMSSMQMSHTLYKQVAWKTLKTTRPGND